MTNFTRSHIRSLVFPVYGQHKGQRLTCRKGIARSNALVSRLSLSVALGVVSQSSRMPLTALRSFNEFTERVHSVSENSLHSASHPFATQPRWCFTTSSHPESYDSIAKETCAPRLTKAPHILDKILLLNNNFLALARSHLVTLSCDFAFVSHTAFLHESHRWHRQPQRLERPEHLFLHSTTGIFFGSNTTRTSLKRATALDARRSVSEICLRGGCRCCHRQRKCLNTRAWL